MSRCSRCRARIPDGRNFCHPHYLEALRDYERELEQYQLDREAWNRLTVEARHEQDVVAEAVEVTMYAFLQGLALGGLTWYAARTLYPIDGLVGLLILGLTTAVSVTWKPMTLLLGRLTRALVYALPKVAIATLLILGLSLISDWTSHYRWALALGLAAIILFTGLIREASGFHRATGEPVVPVEPRP